MQGSIKVKDLAQAMGKTISEIIFILNSLGILKSSGEDELTKEEAQMLLSGQVPTVQKPVIIREDKEKKEKVKKKDLKPPVISGKIIPKESKIIVIPKKKVEKLREEKKEITPKILEELKPPKELPKEKEIEEKREEKKVPLGKKKEEIEKVEKVEEVKKVEKIEIGEKPQKIEKKKKEIGQKPEPIKKFEKKEKIKSEVMVPKLKILEEEEDETLIDLKSLKGKSAKAIEEIHKEQEEAKERIRVKKIKKPAEEEPKHIPLSLKDQVEKLKGLIPKGKEVLLTEASNLRDLIDKLGIKVKDIMPFFMEKGWNVNINQPLSKDLAEKIAQELNFKIKFISFEESLMQVKREKEKGEGTPRAPIVTIMGHVDHGKTTLIDYIRKTKIVETEEGYITQKIGVYEAFHNGKKIVFIDTPGHEAFSYMREKGAKVTDFIILVVATNEGVKPQTEEVINLAKRAKIPIIVALNKIDLGTAEIDKTIKQLAERGQVRDSMGGDTVMVPISALKGTGVNELLDMVLLLAEMNELKADLKAPAKGVVIETKKETGRGIVATVVLQEGILKRGDYFICGSTYGRVKSMVDDRGRTLKEATAGSGFELIGFEELPEPGDILTYISNEDEAKKVVNFRKEKQKLERLKPKIYSIEELLQQKEEGKKTLQIILKADSFGALEVLKQTVQEKETEKVKINIVGEGVGSISYNDATLASTSKAIIIGYGVRIDSRAITQIKAENIKVIIENLIQNITEKVEILVKEAIEPVYAEQTMGRAQVLKIFKIPNVGTILGCKVLSGYIKRGAQVRVWRQDQILFTSRISSLKHNKEDKTEIRQGFECGMGIEKSTDVQENDIIEAFEMVRVE